MSIQRFDLGPHQMTPSSEGAYVRYEDYAQLEEALENLITAADGDIRLAKPKLWDVWASQSAELADMVTEPETLCAVGHRADTVVFRSPPLAAYLREREDKR